MDNTFKSPRRNSNHIKADVIILGCSLPGIVTAHKLKEKFGDSMEIVVLDLAEKQDTVDKYSVAFQEEESNENEEIVDSSPRSIINNVARYFITMFARDFNIPLPDAIVAPAKERSPLSKLFEYSNGVSVECTTDYHDFEYLNVLEKFELNQYQNLLDEYMKDLFQGCRVDDKDERNQLLYYDQTSMEKHICGALLFPNSRNIMRYTVSLVCGVSAAKVSLLFYLHQCYRSSGTRNHLDGNNTKHREKLFGYFRKRLARQLRKSIDQITLSSIAIKKISLHSNERVILRTIKGDTSYVCTLLAMAIKPDELHNIEVESKLLADKDLATVKSMKKGITKKFLIQYEENFWRRDGCSGDILSIRGPILWATERPRLSSTGSVEKYSALVGYLRVESVEGDSQEAVLKQLVRLFGEEAATPICYKETEIADIFVPRCGDFIALRSLTLKDTPKYLEWGALDVFGDGDVASALEAGHVAYLHLMRYLRPQAQTYEDLCMAEWPLVFTHSLVGKWLAHLSIMTSVRFTIYTAAAYIGMRLIQSYLRK